MQCLPTSDVLEIINHREGQQAEVPAKPFPSLLQLFYWEKLSTRMLRFFHSWKICGFLDVMTAETCRFCVCLQTVQKILINGLLTDSLGLAATVNSWGYLLFGFFMSQDIERHQEMSLSLDISVCKHWAMWNSHKCHDWNKRKESSVSMAVVLLFCYQHGVTQGYHRLLSLSGDHFRDCSKKIKYIIFSPFWFLLLHVPYPQCQE